MEDTSAVADREIELRAGGGASCGSFLLLLAGNCCFFLFYCVWVLVVAMDALSIGDRVVAWLVESIWRRA